MRQYLIPNEAYLVWIAAHMEAPGAIIQFSHPYRCVHTFSDVQDTHRWAMDAAEYRPNAIGRNDLSGRSTHVGLRAVRVDD